MTSRSIAPFVSLSATGRAMNRAGCSRVFSAILTPLPALASASASSRPREDSNLRTRFRKPMLYPLSYGGGAGRQGGREPPPDRPDVDGRGASAARSACWDAAQGCRGARKLRFGPVAGDGLRRRAGRVGRACAGDDAARVSYGDGIADQVEELAVAAGGVGAGEPAAVVEGAVDRLQSIVMSPATTTRRTALVRRPGGFLSPRSGEAIGRLLLVSPR